MSEIDVKLFRKEAAGKYPNRLDVIKIAQAATLDTSRIDVSGSSEVMWYNVINEASRHSKFDILLQVYADYSPDPRTIAGHDDMKAEIVELRSRLACLELEIKRIKAYHGY